MYNEPASSSPAPDTALLFISPAFQLSAGTTPSIPKEPKIPKAKLSKQATVEDIEDDSTKAYTDTEKGGRKAKRDTKRRYLPETVIPTTNPALNKKRKAIYSPAPRQTKKAKTADTQTPEVEIQELITYPDLLAREIVLRNSKRLVLSKLRETKEEPVAKRLKAIISIFD